MDKRIKELERILKADPDDMQAREALLAIIERIDMPIPQKWYERVCMFRKTLVVSINVFMRLVLVVLF